METQKENVPTVESDSKTSKEKAHKYVLCYDYGPEELERQVSQFMDDYPEYELLGGPVSHQDYEPKNPIPISTICQALRLKSS